MPDYYTRTGDDGTSGLLGEGRVSKDHPILEAVGALDEASAALGVARAAAGETLAGALASIQRDLYDLMAEVAATPENAARFRKLDKTRVAWLEWLIDQYAAEVDLPKEFILPGDSPTGATFAVVRTIVRRAERRVAQLAHEYGLENGELLRYLNRLSSFCFVMELYENRAWGKITPTLAKDV
jgi:cob(I)alamin adenosyltransferase